MISKRFEISDKYLELVESSKGFVVIEGRIKSPSVSADWQTKAQTFNRFWNRVYTLAIGPRADRSIICKAVVEGFKGFKFNLTLLVGPKGFYLCRHDSSNPKVVVVLWGEMGLMDARIQFADYKSQAKRSVRYPWAGPWE